MQDKTKLGTRYVCFTCGCKFYDLNKPEPLCPECSTDQRQAPGVDMKTLLSGSGRPRPKKIEDDPVPPAPSSDDDDLGFDDADEDDVDDSDDEEEE